MPRAIIYARLSQATEQGTPGLTRQESDCRAYAAAHGLDVVDAVHEVESAYKRTAKRPVWRSVLDRLAAGEAEAVIVWRLDRATRGGVTGLVKVLGALPPGATLYSTSEGLDLDTPMGLGVAGILASVGQQESANTSARVKRARADEARQGRWPTSGRRPYGWTRKGKQVRKEVELLREAARRIIEGETAYAVARDWAGRGVKATEGGEWSAEALRESLRNPRHAGLRVHGGTSHPGTWGSIWSVDYLAEIHAALRGSTPQRTGAYPEALLSGKVLRCVCGGGMRVMSQQKNKGGTMFRRYACHRVPGRPNCGKVTISFAGLEADIARRTVDTLEVLALDPPGTVGGGMSIADIEGALAVEKEAQAELVKDRYVRRRIGEDAFSPAYEALAAKVTALDAALMSAHQRPSVDRLPGPGQAQAWWDGLSPAGKRKAIGDLYLSITVHPAAGRGPRYDGGRVAPKLRPEWLAGRGVEAASEDLDGDLAMRQTPSLIT